MIEYLAYVTAVIVACVLVPIAAGLLYSIYEDYTYSESEALDKAIEHEDHHD